MFGGGRLVEENGGELRFKVGNNTAQIAWGGIITLTSNIPEKLRACDTNTRDFLRDVVQETKLPFRSKLAQWLVDDERFESDKEYEKMHASQLDRPLGRTEIKQLFKALREKYNGMV